MRTCAICGVNADGQEHHMIPKFIFEFFKIKGNSDLYRVVLCNEHHQGVTKAWEKVRFKIKSLDFFDELIEDKFDDDVYLTLLKRSATMQKGSIPLWLEKLIKEGVEEGRRHKTRFKIFSFLNALEIPKEMIKEKILEFNSNCRPPELQTEVDYHIKYLTNRFFGRENY